VEKTCPKCNYTRKSTDYAPDYECPSCGVIYSKFVPRDTTKQVTAVPSVSSVPRRKVLIIAIVIIAIAGIPFLVGSKWFRNWKEAVVVTLQRQELEAKRRVAIEQYKVDIEQYKVDIEPIQQFLDL